MLSPRLTNCPECANIPSLLKKIDCKLAELGNSLYNNVSYMLNQPIPAGSMLQLIAYRRILTHKYCNPNYLHEYSVAMIASRVIRLTVGCVSRCNTPEPCLEVPCDITIVPNPSTTTTSTTQRITTTTTSSTSSTSTTTTSSSSTSTSTTSTTTTAPPTTTTTSSSSTSTTTSTSSSTTTTTTTAYVLACTAGYSGPVGFPNRTTGNGTMTLSSGLVVSTAYTGPSPLLTGIQPPYTNCVGGQFGGDVGIGGTISLNYDSGAFSFIITYSAPQTAVKFVMDGIGYYDQLGISEYYTITTNSTNTIVNVIAGCGDFRVEAPNVVAGSMSNPIDRIGGNIEVVADTSFTTITITGNNSGTLAGTGWDMYICGIEITTTTTTSSSSSTTTTTTTTINPMEVNTIYTHFDAL